ncbi:phosphotransferase [Microbacterium sp. CGR1]|uniref:phosphotransferase n=1 Tax=Microbacterium sp. CGR1 TaxID=1696072 RepID=UPI003DA5C12F
MRCGLAHDSLHFLREEIRAVAMLPPHLGPSVRAAFDTDAGVALVLEAIDGRHPGAPWTAGDLDAIAATMARLSRTPAPVGMERAEDRMIPGFTRWAEIAEDPRLLAGLPMPLCARIPELREIESGFRDALHGDVVVHDDLRADNILISDGEARLLDWPHARRGAARVDLPCLLPSVEASGGPRCEDAWRIFEAHGAPTQQALLPVISGFASFLWFNQAQPEIPQLPGLRAFQRQQAVPALRWLTSLLTGPPDGSPLA